MLLSIKVYKFQPRVFGYKRIGDITPEKLSISVDKCVVTGIQKQLTDIQKQLTDMNLSLHLKDSPPEEDKSQDIFSLICLTFLTCFTFFVFYNCGNGVSSDAF